MHTLSQPNTGPHRAFAALLALALWGASPAVAHADWLKGNTHCHTEVSSDSSTPMEALMAWYKGHGYDFVVITDHNRYTALADLEALEAFDEGLGQVAPLVDETFLIIPGEELTTSEHHVNGLDMPYRVDPGSTIEASFEAVWSAGALPQLNHPEWSFLTANAIVAEIAELDGPMFLEVFNSHPTVVQRSGPSSEDVWDGILSTDNRMWGVAVDDAHTLEGGDKPPGGGYIMVDADARTPEAILDAMQEGRFYASSGASLESVTWTSNVYEVDAPGATEIVFFGENGAILERVSGDFGSYRIQGDELYVRARVESPAGYAWTQPRFVSELPDNPPPTARIEATPTQGAAPLRVTFDARGSSDANGEVVSWRWDFGDGAQGRGEVLVHTYEAPGTYTVELTVFDDDGELDRAQLDVRVEEPGSNNGGTTGTNNATTSTNNSTTPTNNATTSTNNGGVSTNNATSDGGGDTTTAGDTSGDADPPPATRSTTNEGCAQALGRGDETPLVLVLGLCGAWYARRRRRDGALGVRR